MARVCDGGTRGALPGFLWRNFSLATAHLGQPHAELGGLEASDRHLELRWRSRPAEGISQDNPNRRGTLCDDQKPHHGQRFSVVVRADTTSLLLSFDELGPSPFDQSLCMESRRRSMPSVRATPRSAPETPPPPRGRFFCRASRHQAEKAICERHPRAGIRFQDQPAAPKW